MKTRQFAAVAACALAALVPAGAMAQESLVELENEGGFYNSFIKGRLHIGVSYTSAFMKEKRAGAGHYYLGNLDTLREEDTDGFGVSVRYDFCDYVAFHFANDMHTEVSAWNHGSESTDGTLEIDGMLFELILQYPFRFDDGGYQLTPYIGLGVTDVTTHWSYQPWWHNGWSSPADYENYSHGSTEVRKGHSRWMLPEDPSCAFTFSVGVSCELYEHLELDVFYRHVAVDDVDTTFHLRRKNGPLMREGAFPAEFSVVGAAIRYVF